MTTRHRPHRALSLALLTACGSPAAPTHAELDTADAAAPPTVETGWWASVSPRIQADARSIQPGAASSFQASLPAARMTGRWDRRGLEATDHQGGRIGLQLVGWGSEEVVIPVETVAPVLGDCAEDGQEDPSGACIQRLEYQHPGLTEWWLARADGLEQGWVVEDAPAGEGSLVFVLSSPGAEIELLDENAAFLMAEDGSAWTYGGVVAWDADGRPLPGRLSVEAGQLQVEVEADDARFPVVVDPVLSSADSVLYGEAVASSFGFAVSDAGDVNGDGYGDVIVGAYEWSNFTGRAYIYHGSAAGLSTTAARTLVGGTAKARFGYAVSGMGDVNGDGYDDIVVSAPKYSSNRGRVYLYHGSASGIGSATARLLTGPTSNNFFGEALSGAGDVNGDGYDDIIIGSRGWSSNRGRAYIYHGSASGIPATSALVLPGDAGGNWFGDAVSSAGDVNGDGYDDVIIGALGYTSKRGKAFIHHGSPTGLSATEAIALSGEFNGNYFGDSVSGAGDLNGDGYDDVIVGAPLFSGSTGRAYIFMGSGAGVGDTASAVLTGEATGNFFGRSVSGAGDVENDGYDDVIIGADGYSTSTGRAYVLRGSATGLDTSRRTALTGSILGSYFGYSVSDAGDINGDGKGDIIVGAYGYGGRAGEAQVFLGYADTDADGVADREDCDPNDPAVGGPSTFYVDSDLDGHGDRENPQPACEAAPGLVANYTDCDDTDPAVFGAESRYIDADGDGFGSDTLEPACDENGYSDNSDDCDDGDPSIGERATWYLDYDEDGIGDEERWVRSCSDLESRGFFSQVYGDCDDLDPTVADSLPWYADTDGDGAGDAAVVVNACEPPEGYVGDNTDCDDTDSSVPGVRTWYEDADGDGFGSPASFVVDCYAPAGFVATGDDCDDSDASLSPADVDGDGFSSCAGDCDDAEMASYPGATEVCDGIDNDCDGAADGADSEDASTWYADVDSDGYGDPMVGSTACEQPAGFVANAEDCIDSDASMNPTDADADGFSSCDGDCDDANDGAWPTRLETCDDIDNDCDGEIDEAGAVGEGTFYADVDGDGYGDLGSASTSCDQPAGTVSNSEDCDDADARRTPADGDGDGFSSCDSDCDDAQASAFPGATEACDDIDNDCDGEVDEAGSVGEGTFYADADGDGYGDLGSASTSCDQPAGTVTNSDDCDDARAEAFPAATEVCDGLDNDCDGMADEPDAVDAPTWYSDVDGDGYGDLGSATPSCSQPAGTVANGDDCDDANVGASPSATEACDGIDNDCDGEADESGSAGEAVFYADADGDGHGDPASVVMACGQPAGTVTIADDCDDAAATTFPGASDTCGDGIDQDCNGVGDDPSDDEDGDGISLGQETLDGGDDCNADDDNDGTPTRDESGDRDEDGIPDYVDSEDDPMEESSITIDFGAEWTPLRASVLTIDPPDSATRMCISNTDSCSAWTTARRLQFWDLQSGDGLKTVTVWFRNAAGDIISVASDTIGLDSVDPMDGSATFTSSTGQVAVSWSDFSDATSGVAGYRVVYVGGSTAPSTCLAGKVAYQGTDTSVTLERQGSHPLKFRVCAYDRAGNLSHGTIAKESKGSGVGKQATAKK